MRNRQNRTILLILIAVLVVLLIAAIITLIGMGQQEKPYQPGSSTGEGSSSKPSSDATEDVILATPYGALVYPGQWAEYLETEVNDGEDYGITFFAELERGKTQPLFMLEFGEPKSPAVGQLTTQDGITVGVYVTIYDLDPDESWTDQEKNIVTGMQEALNDVLASLNLQSLGTAPPELQGEELVIETPYGKLYFPGRWAEELEITTDESDGYEIVFHGTVGTHKALPLFAVNFGGSNGTVVHTMTTDNGVVFHVRLRTFPLDTEGWSAIDAATIRAMQEDLNHLLAKLREE